MTPLFRLLLVTLSLLYPLFFTNAAINPKFEDNKVFYQFGRQATFQIRITPADTISNISLIIQPEKSSAQLFTIESVDSTGGIVFLYNIQDRPFRPFSKITYWYKVTQNNGVSTTSPAYAFDYLDNRFSWQQIENSQFKIFWAQGKIEFGQMALNIAQRGLSSVQNLLPIEPQSRIQIYIYSSPEDIHTAINIDKASWIAGEALIDKGIILVSTPPGFDQRLELERQIPHEMMHILTYQMTRESFHNVPVWLSEGIASLAELYPNPDYQSALDRAVKSETLIPMKNLCNGFPTDPDNARLAYAQSASFVRFFIHNYGRDGLGKLLEASKSGRDCNGIISTSFSTTLVQLENKWWQDGLKFYPRRIILGNLFPYFFIFIILVLPFFAAIIIPRKYGISQGEVIIWKKMN